MVNRILGIFIFIFIFTDCKRHRKETDPCNLEDIVNGNSIDFRGFGKMKFYRVIFQDLNDDTHYTIWNEPNAALTIDKKTMSIIQNGCCIIINDSIEYRVTDVVTRNAEYRTMLGSTGFFCELVQYKLNDSLIGESFMPSSIDIYK